MGLIKAAIGVVLIGFGVSLFIDTVVDIAKRATDLPSPVVPTVPEDATEEWKSYIPPSRAD